MAKKVKAVIKLQLPAGEATPAPPVGPALGQYGVNIMAFCKDYNERTQAQVGSVIPVELTIYDDRSFTFIVKTSPVSDLLKKALGAEKGSASAKTQKIGKITMEQIRHIAELKMNDLNAIDIQGAVKMIEGTARSMGIEVSE
jgi:large subunit ribosomal protein L11